MNLLQRKGRPDWRPPREEETRKGASKSREGGSLRRPLRVGFLTLPAPQERGPRPPAPGMAPRSLSCHAVGIPDTGGPPRPPGPPRLGPPEGRGLEAPPAKRGGTPRGSCVRQTPPPKPSRSPQTRLSAGPPPAPPVCEGGSGGGGSDVEEPVYIEMRGVTYVDITVGSLVCTGCSGALRGLNPPHRVKSISMTTFTEAEVLFLQARGNEVCRRVWLGTFDPRTSLLPDSRDPQKVKEFLQEKYEKKRWYVALEQAKPPQTAATEPAPTQPLLGDAGTLLQPRPVPHRPPQPARKASTDLLADIGGDPFATPQPAPAFATFPGPAQPHAAFPNFDAFGAGQGASAFGGAAPPFHTPPAPTGGSAVQGGATSVPPPGGGASASLFGTLQPPPALPPPPYGGYTNPFTAPATPRPSTNPFQSNGPAAGAAFTTPPVPGGFPSPFQADGSPFGGFNVAKASTNPFVTVPAPTAPFGIKHPTTNPFL
ncbi:arf-GAP domain and FG repeat-containing protein 2 [Grus japonensis]|uniref:Arf-GAP domain and FG repeat-containing protein 2 n=1 Tax=Grus japonensis TaxID=30415 RepID=A0ABC9XTW8_GRUJA